MHNEEISKSGLPPITEWYERHLVEFHDCLFSLVERRGRIAHGSMAIDYYLSNSNFVEWQCYTCHCDIQIDITKFTGKDVFCKDHKPKIFGNAFKKDIILLRYVNSLFHIIQSKIEKNSHSIIK